MRDRVRKHIEERFAGAAIDHSPFPHLIINDFFPADIYGQILDHNPFKTDEGVAWMSRRESAQVSSATPYHARKQINFHADQSFTAPDRAKAFWDEFKTIFIGDDWFPRLVAEKSPELFRFRFGDLMDEADIFGLFRNELFLQRHEPGYHIGPHTDIPTRIFTCIFSFAREDGWERFGTELLAPRDRLDRCWGNDHHDHARFTVSKLAPYRPNNFLLFHKTRQSFHSVAAIDETVPDQRYGMQFQLYEPHGGLFNDLSAPALMHVVRPGRATLAKRLARKMPALLRR